MWGMLEVMNKHSLEDQLKRAANLNPLLIVANTAKDEMPLSINWCI